MRLTGGGDLASLEADVQDLQGSVLTSVKKFETWDEFKALVTEAPAGVYTLTQSITGAGVIPVPAGALLVGGAGSAITGPAPGGLVFVCDVDGPALSSFETLVNVQVIQSSAGASAVALEVTAPGPFVPIMQTLQLVGGRVGVLFTAIATAAKLEATISINADVGFRVDGSVTSVTLEGCATQSAVVGHRGVDVAPTATVFGGVLINIPAFNLAAGQWGFSVAHGATFIGGALMQVAGASLTGPQGNMFRQTAPGVTDMDIDDDRLVVKGGPSVANWLASAVASRFDSADPLIVDNSTAGAGVPAVIPYEDGAGNLEITASELAHFTLFKNPADPLDWYFEYTGSNANVTARLASDVLADRGSAGPSEAILFWERAPFIGPGHGPFAVVPQSGVPWENTNSLTPRSGIATSPGTNTSDRFRPLISDSSATDVRLGEIKLDLQISS
jgi:hypothetical protein